MPRNLVAGPAKWKIYYTDGTSLLWSDVSPIGDPKLIPNDKRIGVHSILQPFENESSRQEVMDQYYVFSIRDNNWMGIKIESLLDHIANDFDNIGCILNGRTMTTEKFWEFRLRIRSDPDIIGEVDAERAAREAYMFEGRHNNPRWTNYWPGNFPEKDNLSARNWVDLARHRPYREDLSEKPVYGHSLFYY